MMEKYAMIRDGHLGQILVTKQRNQVSMEMASVHSHPFRTGPRQRQLESDIVNNF